MLDKLFTSTTRVKVLRVLMFNPDRWFYLRELARKVKTTPTYVKKEIENLKELGLVNGKRQGNLTFFCINQNSQIFNELRELFIKSDYLLFRQMYAKTDTSMNPEFDFERIVSLANDNVAEHKTELIHKINKLKQGVLDEKES